MSILIRRQVPRQISRLRRYQRRRVHHRCTQCHVQDFQLSFGESRPEEACHRFGTSTYRNELTAPRVKSNVKTIRVHFLPILAAKSRQRRVSTIEQLEAKERLLDRERRKRPLIKVLPFYKAPQKNDCKKLIEGTINVPEIGALPNAPKNAPA